MKFQPDAEGWYIHHPADPPYRLCPLDTTNDKTWADSILMRVKAVIKYGLGNLMPDGTPYPLNDFLFDTHGGAIADNDICYHLVACIEYKHVMSEFYRIYGVEFCPVDPEQYLIELDLTS